MNKIKFFTNAGLGRVAGELFSLMKKSIIMSTYSSDEEKIILGKSKMGGSPDLPNQWEWPSWKDIPLAFICQINLEEIYKLDSDCKLPKEGILYFFYEADSQPWGFDPNDKGACKVLYYKGNLNKLKRIRFPNLLPVDSRFESCSISFKCEYILPEAESLQISRLLLSSEEFKSYKKLEKMIKKTKKDTLINRICGYADSIQGEMETECTYVTNGIYWGDQTINEDYEKNILKEQALNWELLLQIDSNEQLGMMWGDCGRIYYWINNDDLEVDNFENVWLILQCY